jgi:NitT/TauT family transport system substrate-binding protein
VADGTYKKYGLEVTIQQGGPQVNNRPLLPAGRIDFLMTGNLLHTSTTSRTACPRGGGRHVPEGPAGADRPPRPGLREVRGAEERDRCADRQGRPVQLVAVAEGDARLQGRALKPYNYNLGPFLANNKAIQQGYSVAEPIYVENQGKFKPVVHLLADHGFSTYTTVIEARTDTVKNKPDLVQRFVDASASSAG